MIPRIVPKPPARDGDGDLQPDAPGVVRGRVRVPRAAARHDRRAVVRARRRHRVLRARRRSRRSGCRRRHRSPTSRRRDRRAFHEPIDQLREGLAAISGNREVSRPLLHLAAAASLVGVIGVLGPNLASSLGLDPKNLIVVVLPLGLGVVGGVFGLRRFGGGRPAPAGRRGRPASRSGCWRVGDRGRRPDRRRRGLPVDPARRRPRVLRRRRLRGDDGLGPDRPVREHAGRGARPRSSACWRRSSARRACSRSCRRARSPTRSRGRSSSRSPRSAC